MNIKNSVHKIYFNFSYYALRLLGKGLYSNAWTAIAELVANGFDAKAGNVKIYINATNKEKSVIEIFDDGYGMGYEDLINKYSVIGKNKRNDNSLDQETKKHLMGRKGIGKLAALYLSKKYYLISKTETEYSAWCLNAKNVDDSDIPRLDRIDISDIDIETKEYWNKNKTGTMIKLTDVDLRNFGVQSLKGLKARLADFFLLDSLSGKMEVAFIIQRNAVINFEKVEKEIAFKNMYAFFDNTEYNLKKELRTFITFRSPVEEVARKNRQVIFFDRNYFSDISGERCFLGEDGSKTEKRISYNLTGWIGIHSTIDKENASKNDKRYLKNKVYNPNKLRLYVRKKLAVENILEYLHNTQAFGNYIEGEISFDVLDDDNLPDIATSNRQGFDEENDRVKLLIEILKPIVNTLIKQRLKIADEIKAEEKNYYDAQERIAKEKEEAAQKRAEIAEERTRQEIEAKVRAQHETQAALIQKETAEKETELAKMQLTKKVEQLKIVTSLSSQDLETITNLHHQINVVALNIQDILNLFSKKHPQKNFIDYKETEELLNKISFENNKIIALSRFGIKKIFDDFSTKSDYNIIEYLENYIEKITTSFTSKSQLHIDFSKKKNSFIATFAPIDISIIIDNMVNNAKKARAKEMEIDCSEDQNNFIIRISSNRPFDENITNLQNVFEKGFSTTKSTGVGLYHIRNIIIENGWKIDALRENNRASFYVYIPKENKSNANKL